MLARAAAYVVGTARLCPGGQIGRMAVRRTHCGRGVGAQLLMALLELAPEQALTHVWLSAQTGVIGFYRRHGFVAEGQAYRDAGILHQRMSRAL